jgi:hypothetical protein
MGQVSQVAVQVMLRQRALRVDAGASIGLSRTALFDL